MRSTSIHPHDTVISISSNDVENYSQYSRTCLFLTRRRCFCLSISVLSVILVGGFAIPLTVAFSRYGKTDELPTITANESSIAFNSTINAITQSALSTIYVDSSMVNTITNISFVSNDTLERSSNIYII